MASWSIHLGVAKRVNEKLKLNKDLFYLGNLIPDVDYGNKVSKKDTHFYYNNPCLNCPKIHLPNSVMFLSIYKDSLNDDLIMGYYVHLLTDYFYNKYIYSNCLITNDDKDIVGVKLKTGKIKYFLHDDIFNKKYKQYDLVLYGKYLFNKNSIELPRLDNNLENSLLLLKDKFYSIEDMKKKIYYLNGDFIKLNKINFKERIFGYKLFYKKELDKLFDDCVDFILKEINKTLD